MNQRSLTVTLGALAAFTLGACTVGTTTSSSGTGGATSATTGSDATASATTSGGTGGSGGDATTTGTSTGTAMCDPMYKCVDAIAPGSGDPALLCDGPARMKLDALAACTCSGNCAATCKDNACTQQDPSPECKACLSTPDTGCKKEFDDCVGG